MSYWKKCISTGDYQYIVIGNPAPGEIVVQWWEVALARKDKRIAELEAQVPKVVTPRSTDILGHKTCDCGNNVRVGSRFCSNCGSKLNWEKK